jgi:hypothetical protein
LISCIIYIYIYIYYCEISYLIELRSYRIRLASNRLDKIRRTSTRESDWKLWSVQPGRTSTRGSGLNFCPKPNSTARLDQSRQIEFFVIMTSSTNQKDSSSSCRWEHMNKLLYCVFCKVQFSQLRKRQTFEKIRSNYIKRWRESQTTWRCSSCDSCCKKKTCWETLHS